MVRLQSVLKTTFILSLILSCNTPQKEHQARNIPRPSGPYLGQKSPGDEPQLFAPGFISTALYTRDLTMTPGGEEIYFCVSASGFNLIFNTKQKDGYWTEPQPASFISDYNSMYYEPHITADGRRMLFLSDMAREKGKAGNQDIRAVDRVGNAWSKPYNIGSPVNTDDAEFFPSTTRNGTLYFTRAEKGSALHYIYRSRLINKKYTDPERLNERVNCGANRFNAFIDPDERFVIVPAVGMADSYGGVDYYIVFRDENDNWSKPLNMGPKINSKNGREFSAYISPDGKYLFFMSAKTKHAESGPLEKPTYAMLKKKHNLPQNGNADIYWIETDFIDNFKPDFRK